MHFQKTYWPMFHRILFNKLYNTCIPIMQAFMPRPWPVSGSWWADHAPKQFAECHVNLVEIFFQNRPMTCSKTSHWSDNCIKISESCCQWHMSISQYPSICIKCPQGCLKMEINVCIWQPPAWSKHPSHLCVETRSKTSTVTTPRVCNCCGGWAWVVKIFVLFLRFNVKSTCASEATSSSNKRHALSNVVQNKGMSSANRKSNKGWPSSRDNPELPFSHAMRTRPSLVPN